MTMILQEGERIRTLGLYQPFASLMLHGKIETRWVKKGKKAPFPLGKYLIYSTKKGYTGDQALAIMGADISIDALTKVGYPNLLPNGMALAIGTLQSVFPMLPSDAEECFVKYVESETHDLYCLEFKDMKPIEPFDWKYGKQGIGFVPESELANIKFK